MKAISSGLKAADAAIFAAPCWYLGISIVGDDGTDVVATVWDSPDTTTTNDTEIDYIKCTDEKYNMCHIMKFPVWCAKGISVVMDAAEGDYIVWYAL